MKALSDELISAYVDGELDHKKQSQVEAWLAEHPDSRAKLEHFQLQKKLHKFEMDQ